MAKTQKITLEFACPEKLNDKLFCEKCSRHVIDFRDRTTDEVQKEIGKAARPVCGIFKKSQLSDQFLKYAAATFIATSLTMPALGQKLIARDALLKTIEKNEEWALYGLVVDKQAEPVGGYRIFLEAIHNRLNYPPGLSEKGQALVEFTVDANGKMKDVKLMKGFNELADQEAVRAVGSLEFPFTPGKQKDIPIDTRLVVAVLFDPRKNLKV